jgi:hypothetical protein
MVVRLKQDHDLLYPHCVKSKVLVEGLGVFLSFLSIYLQYMKDYRVSGSVHNCNSVFN